MASRLRRAAAQGFTLVEVLLVIIVIGILAAITLPMFLDQEDKAQDTGAKTRLATAYKAARSYATSKEGKYGSPADVAAAIAQAEPQLGTPQTANSVNGVQQDRTIYVIVADDEGNLQLASRSDSQNVLLMSVRRNSSPSYKQAKSFTYSELVLNDGAVNYWPLSETSGTTADNLGIGPDGTFNEIVLNQTPLHVGGGPSARFGSANGRVAVSASTALAPPNQFTIELWVRLTGAVSGNRGLYNLGRDTSGGGTSGALLYTSTDRRLRAGVYGGGSSGVISADSGSALDIGTPYHVAMVYGGGSLRLYVNGVAVASPVSTASYVPSPAIANTIGYYGSGTSLPADISDVAIYPEALGAQQLRAHYSAGCGC